MHLDGRGILVRIRCPKAVQLPRPSPKHDLKRTDNGVDPTFRPFEVPQTVGLALPP